MSGIELLGTLYRLLRDAGEVQSSCVLFAACYAAETSRGKARTGQQVQHQAPRMI